MNVMRIPMMMAIALLFAMLTACSDDTSAVDAVSVSKDGGPGDGARFDGADAMAAEAVVSTASGPVRGKVAAKTRSFLGIPFAAPPLGALRFAAPQPVASWTAIRDATTHGPACPQEPVAGFGAPKNQSEDCLSLAVWTPNPTPQKKLPVMVWIHGGAFIIGSSSNSLYDGRGLASTGEVIVVAFNYRLGPLGTFAHPKLKTADGNFSFLDQQAALRWVKKNIAAFGGDPDNVTIFGESAGAVSVCLHLVADGSKGLFHRAVMESGSCWWTRTRAEVESQGEALAKALGCDTVNDPIACLRGKKPEELNKALPTPAGFFLGTGAVWTPFVDGASLKEQPQASLAAKKQQKVPVIIGSNKNEGTLFVSLAKMEKISAAEYKTAVEALAPDLGVKAADVLAKYPVASFSSPADALAELLGDAAFVCQARRLARQISGDGVATYLYHFERTPIGYLLYPFYRASHAAEIPFVFGNYLLGLEFPAVEFPLQQAMSNYWRRFASSADPNGGSDPMWPSYKKASDEHLILDLKIAKGAGLKSAICDFWDTAEVP